MCFAVVCVRACVSAWQHIESVVLHKLAHFERVHIMNIGGFTIC